MEFARSIGKYRLLQSKGCHGKSSRGFIRFSHEVKCRCLVPPGDEILQEMHVDDPKLKISGHLLEVEGYNAHYSCSATKKVILEQPFYQTSNDSIPRRQAFLKETSHTWQLFQWYQKTNVASSTKGETTASLGSVDVASAIPQKVLSCETMGYPEHDYEGHILAVDFPRFFLANLYVPNSGAFLDRLSYQTEKWDTDLLEFIQKKEMEKPVWNEGMKHLAKSAGTTPEEHAPFAQQLDAQEADGVFVIDLLEPACRQPCAKQGIAVGLFHMQ
eukprot:scaffold40485_cov30-Attheya_sp.AAC.1